jgi:UDP-N-acetylmuramoylalanine-D-glutamate ligase
MLAAKVEETAIISLWHYFCALEASYSVYLTGNNNKNPIKELLISGLRAQGHELRVTGNTSCSVLCALRSELKNESRFDYCQILNNFEYIIVNNQELWKRLKNL